MRTPKQAGSFGGREALELQRAILAIHLDSVGMNVEQTLDEIDELLWVEDLAASERCTYLMNAVEEVGSRFVMADRDLGLARGGHLTLNRSGFRGGSFA